MKNEIIDETDKWFKEESLKLIRHNIANNDFNYPGYPETRFHNECFENLVIPDGPWHISPKHPGITEELNEEDTLRFKLDGLSIDQKGRPLHPWINELIKKDIGVFTGKGFYYDWGPNKTVDPVVIRSDLDEPHVMLIVRDDTGKIALPGGFHDPGETFQEGAAREAREETLVDIGDLACRLVYSGPLADSRATANSWPHTDAFRFDMPDEIAKEMPMKWDGGEEVECAFWLPVSKVEEHIFGSHSLLITLANRIGEHNV